MRTVVIGIMDIKDIGHAGIVGQDVTHRIPTMSLILIVSVIVIANMTAMKSFVILRCELAWHPHLHVKMEPPLNAMHSHHSLPDSPLNALAENETVMHMSEISIYSCKLHELTEWWKLACHACVMFSCMFQLRYNRKGRTFYVFCNKARSDKTVYEVRPFTLFLWNATSLYWTWQNFDGNVIGHVYEECMFCGNVLVNFNSQLNVFFQICTDNETLCRVLVYELDQDSYMKLMMNWEVSCDALWMIKHLYKLTYFHSHFLTSSTDLTPTWSDQAACQVHPTMETTVHYQGCVTARCPWMNDSGWRWVWACSPHSLEERSSMVLRSHLFLITHLFIQQ